MKMDERMGFSFGENVFFFFFLRNLLQKMLKVNN